MIFFFLEFFFFFQVKFFEIICDCKKMDGNHWLSQGSRAWASQWEVEGGSIFYSVGMNKNKPSFQLRVPYNIPTATRHLHQPTHAPIPPSCPLPRPCSRSNTPQDRIWHSRWPSRDLWPSSYPKLGHKFYQQVKFWEFATM